MILNGAVLDTSFIIAGIGKRPQSYALLDSLLGHPLHLSELVWAEALHVLTKTLVGNDFRALLWGRPRGTLGEKALLVPYQNLAAAALRTFVDAPLLRAARNRQSPGHREKPAAVFPAAGRPGTRGPTGQAR